MFILAIRTDKPEAEIALFNGQTRLADISWQAHRQLAETINNKIEKLLQQAHKTPDDLGGIVCFAGPGSFTGLRIGLSVANALAYALQIPIIAAGGEAWAEDAIRRLQNGEDVRVAVPDYGAPVHITTPKK